MANFMQRVGLVPVRDVLQKDSLDEASRVMLWNLVHVVLDILVEQDRRTGFTEDSKGDVLTRLWTGLLTSTLDTYTDGRCVSALRKKVLDGSWAEALYVIDELASSVERSDEKLAKEVRKEFNERLKSHLVGYRFVGGELSPVTSEVEVEAIENALGDTQQWTGANTALQNAISLLSDRDAPKYAKSLAESIHAVEAVVRHLTGQKTLADGLKALKNQGFPTHPALLDGWIKLYGYAGDGANIRHGSIEDADVDEALAVYFLASCSAFISLLVKSSSG